MKRLIIVVIMFFFSQQVVAGSNSGQPTEHYKIITPVMEEEKIDGLFLETLNDLNFMSFASISDLMLWADSDKPIDEIEEYVSNTISLRNYDNVLNSWVPLITSVRVLNYRKELSGSGLKDSKYIDKSTLDYMERKHAMYAISVHNDIYERSFGDIDLLEQKGKIEYSEENMKKVREKLAKEFFTEMDFFQMFLQLYGSSLYMKNNELLEELESSRVFYIMNLEDDIDGRSMKYGRLLLNDIAGRIVSMHKRKGEDNHVQFIRSFQREVQRAITVYE